VSTEALNAHLAPYAQLGGDDGVRALVDAFYDRMDLEEGFRGIRALHPPTLDGSRDKLYLFLSGWLGGPDLYGQRVGHPRLRARHLPFAIAGSERDQWLACMRMALADVSAPAIVRENLMRAFFDTADWMRNQSEPGSPG